MGRPLTLPVLLGTVLNLEQVLHEGRAAVKSDLRSLFPLRPGLDASLQRSDSVVHRDFQTYRVDEGRPVKLALDILLDLPVTLGG
jgi:hypothetical protein